MTESWIGRLREAQLGELDRGDPGLAAYVRQSGGVLLYRTIGSEGFLRPDGSVWIYEAENWGAQEEVRGVWREASREERWAGLVLGTARLPEVARLLPERPPGVPDCERCGGAGLTRSGAGESGVICSRCWGLGWPHPPESASAQAR